MKEYTMMSVLKRWQPIIRIYIYFKINCWGKKYTPKNHLSIKFNKNLKIDSFNELAISRQSSALHEWLIRKISQISESFRRDYFSREDPRGVDGDRVNRRVNVTPDLSPFV